MKPGKRSRLEFLLVGLMGLAFLLNGCATGATTAAPTPSPGNVRMEQLLTEAGFISVPESSNLCRRVCSRMTPDTLVPQVREGKKAYGYYSPESQRLYMGDEAAYQNFINLAVQRNLESRYRSLGPTENDPEFWTLWQDMRGGG